MRPIVRSAVLAVLVMVLPADAQTAADLTLRSGVRPPEGQVTGCSVEGVTVTSPVTGDVLIGWEQVRAVLGEHADEARAYAEVSDSLWRALARLDRGDIPAAEPMLEGLFVTYRGRAGPTAAAVSAGLLRCRLERGAHTLAVTAWLSWLYAAAPSETRWSGTTAPTGGALAGIDAETGLLPELPPIWLDLPAVRVFGDAPTAAAGFGEREQALAELYAHAARVECGAREPMPRLASGDAGVRLVWDIIAAQSPSAQERAAGRKAVEARLKKEPTGWTDAWLRTARGRSLLVEPEPEQRQRGVIELLRVRVLHDGDAPYLAGLALAESVVALLDLGDARSAALLREELLDRFPGHPATGTEPILMWEGPHEGPADRTTSGTAGYDARRATSLEGRTPNG